MDMTVPARNGASFLAAPIVLPACLVRGACLPKHPSARRLKQQGALRYKEG